MNTINQIGAMGYIIREDKRYLPYRDCNNNKVFHLYVTNSYTNKEVHIHCGDKTMYFLGENKASSVEEAEELISQGEGIKIIGAEFYRQYYNLNEEEFCIFQNGYDLKVQKYLDGVKNQIGLLHYTSDANSSITPEGEYTLAPEDCKSMEVFLNSSEVVYWQMDNREWIAQYGFQIEIDDYAVTKFYFKDEPTDYKIRVAHAISQIEIDFRLNSKQKAEQMLENLKEFINNQ